MSWRSVLPHFIQPFRLRHAEQAMRPISVSPLDMLRLMEFVERSSIPRTGEFAAGASAENASVLAPEQGFRY